MNKIRKTFFQLNVSSNKQMLMNFCLFVACVVFIVQSIFLPVITCYLLALMAFRKVPKLLQACLVMYIVLVWHLFEVLFEFFILKI